MAPTSNEKVFNLPTKSMIKIVANNSYHGFSVGEVAELVDPPEWAAKDYDMARTTDPKDWWYLKPSDYVIHEPQPKFKIETELDSLRKSFSIVPSVKRFEELLTADVAAEYEAIIAERVEDTVKQRMVKFELDTIRKVEELAKPKLEYERKEIFRQVFLQQTEKLVEILYRRRKEDGAILAQLEGAMTTIREAPNALVRHQVQAEIQKPLLPKDEEEEDPEDECDWDECEGDCDEY